MISTSESYRNIFPHIACFVKKLGKRELCLGSVFHAKLMPMRKLVSALAMLLLSAMLCASSISTAGIALGGTMKDNAFTAGLSATTVQASDYNRHFGTGIGAGMDISMMFTEDERNGLFAGYIGPGFFIRPFENLAVSAAIGPCLVTEHGSFGLGYAINCSVAYFINDDFGFSIGVTGYTQFYVDDDARDNDASFAGSGYIGVTWRHKNYDWDTNTVFDMRKP